MNVLVFKFDKDRHEFMKEQLSRVKIDYEFIECVVGKDLTDDEISQNVDKGSMERSPDWFTRGSIGAGLSFQLALKRIIEKGYDYALFMEDDAVLPPNFDNVIPKIEPHIIQGEIILLYYAKYRNNHQAIFSSIDQVPIDEKYSLVFPIDENQVTTAVALILTREACINMLKVNTPLKVIGDSWNYYYQQKAIAGIRCIYPLLIIPADFKSSIDYVETKYKRIPIVRVVLDLVNKYKIFPLYQILRNRRTRYRLANEQFIFREVPSVFSSFYSNRGVTR